jgi:hypothetical protein
MVKPVKWKVDRVMAIWGITFGVAATLTGMFVLKAVQGGFLAEGFFLIVLSWVLLLVLVAKLVDKIRRM